jgi:hypothetical protein
MIPIETQIFRLIFPPSGSIPLEKLEAVPHIRQHINSIIDLASTEHGIHTPDESAALTARVIELRDTPGPDGKVRTWRTIAEICGTTIDAVRHRYGKGKATIRKSRTVETLDSPTLGVLREKSTPQIMQEATLTGYDIKDKLTEFQNIEGATAPDVEFTEIELQTPQIPQGFTLGSAEGAPVIGHVEPFVGDLVVSESAQEDHPPKTETEPPQEAEPTNLEEPPEQEKKQDEVATIRESRNVPLDPETLAEVDRMLGDGIGVLDIAAELEKKGKLVPWTKIRARAAYIGRMKGKAQAKPESKKADDPEPVAQPGEEPQEAEATETRPEPVSISRSELNIMIWDLWKAGKTLEEISDILYDKGLYYSAKSVRIRLLQQGAKL